MNQPLTTILITRPVGQHQAFAARCSELGLRIAHLPCLAIEPLRDVQLSATLLENTDCVLFTSKNAVLHAHQQRPLPWPVTRVNAIGPATTAALAAFNQPVDLKPKPPFTSESYLQQLESLPPQKLLIIKGLGGRTLISNRLSALGWCVQGVDVYQRCLPVFSQKNVASLLEDSPPKLISTTSNEALENLKILAYEHWDTLIKLPIIVNSERTAALAQSMGFEQPALVAKSAGDEGQLEQVILWLSRQ
jgi:uroporphyrinogen-III synthase